MSKKITFGALYVALLVIIVFMISSLPILIGANSKGVVLNGHAAWSAVTTYVKGLFSGDSFIYFYGKNEHDFLSEAARYAGVSFFYVTVALVAGLWLSVFAGMAILRWRLRLAQEAILMLSVIPDFVIVISLQLMAIWMYRNLGIHIMIASFADKEAVLLPVVSIMVVPFIYLLRQIIVHMQQVVTEDYIMLAKAKGLSKTSIYYYHVLPNVLPSLRAELPKLIGMLFGNLFIIEYLFNLLGITRLLFQKAAPFNLTANCLFVLFLMYFIVLSVGKLSIWGLERITTR